MKGRSGEEGILTYCPSRILKDRHSGGCSPLFVGQAVNDKLKDALSLSLLSLDVIPRAKASPYCKSAAFTRSFIKTPGLAFNCCLKPDLLRSGGLESEGLILEKQIDA